MIVRILGKVRRLVLHLVARAARGVVLRRSSRRGLLRPLRRAIACIVRACEHGGRSDSLERDRQQHQPYEQETDGIFHAAILARPAPLPASPGFDAPLARGV
ncbi:hypothetical protein FVD38_12050 [Massilia arenae]|uniref:Uncharacterized protein n=1 Tax=Massilia arenae TaxID=2603288 RepID=A0A5C7FTH9_9BURK|nr:hypothetical protein FVD38_12050 [Massilia arenae]